MSVIKKEDRETIEISANRLHHIGVIISDVLHEKKAVNAIGSSTQFDLENQLQHLLNLLRNKNSREFIKLLESTNHLKSCGYKGFDWE
jgi:hypothetical protein|tara:strand:- start:1930 stop:2193 length:264 start_codon:yes stop_codon:yes gene_type:complete